MSPLRFFRLLAMLLLSAAFLLSGITKVLDPLAFAATLFNSPLFSAEVLQGVLPALAFYLPWLELLLGLAIWLSTFRAAALGLLGGLLGLFSLYLLGLAILGVNLPCGCFGNLLPFDSTAGSLIRNAVLLFCVALLAWPTPSSPRSSYPEFLEP